MKIYLAGPMRGHDNYNFEAFFVAEALLEMRGHKVINPARLDIEDGKAAWSPTEGRINAAPDFTIQDALRRDILAMAESCEAIVLLPGWEKSKGAKAELEFARVIGLKEFEYDDAGEICALGATKRQNQGVSIPSPS